MGEKSDIDIELYFEGFKGYALRREPIQIFCTFSYPSSCDSAYGRTVVRWLRNMFSKGKPVVLDNSTGFKALDTFPHSSCSYQLRANCLKSP